MTAPFDAWELAAGGDEFWRRFGETPNCCEEPNERPPNEKRPNKDISVEIVDITEAADHLDDDTKSKGMPCVGYHRELVVDDKRSGAEFPLDPNEDNESIRCFAGGQ
jgi:hypothetical protein